MPKPRKSEEVRCRYFRWILRQRNGVWFGDGRANSPSVGRHSLGERDRQAALAALQQLDLVMAVEHGLADRQLLKHETTQRLDLSEGRRLYEEYVGRPAIARGPRVSTAKRYRAVLDKFFRFADETGLRTWNEVQRQTLDAYAARLDDDGYAYATQYLELNTLKQILKFLVQEKHLPAEVLFPYPMQKKRGTDRWCWRREEVAAMLEHCEQPRLQWLRAVIVGLSRTGLRISELAGLRWADIDLDKGMLTLTDESTSKLQAGREVRTTKSGRNRSIPIHPELHKLLRELPRPRDGRVFHGPLGGKIKPDTARRILVRDVLKPLIEKFPQQPGTPGFADGRLHSFRHYFCSECANAGVPERVLMDWLGHRNSEMVQHYYHLHDEESKRQMDRISQPESNEPDSL